MPSRAPRHNVSGASWSKATAARAPSTSSHSRFLRPGETWLMTAAPMAPPSVSICTVTASSVVTVTGLPSGPGPLGDGDLRARRQPRDLLAGDELGQVAPVRADVGERARGAARRGVDAPVAVLGIEQPVLQIGAVDEAHRPGVAAAHALARLADRGIEAIDERHRRDDVGRRGLAGQRLGARAVGGQGLLADDVAARGQRRRGQRAMQVVRRADVDDVDVAGLDHLLGARGPLGPQVGGRLGRAFRRRRRDGHDARAGQPRGASMDRADHPRADDARPQRSGRAHERCIAASKATSDGGKSIPRTKPSASRAPCVRSMPESSHSIDSGPS